MCRVEAITKIDHELNWNFSWQYKIETLVDSTSRKVHSDLSWRIKQSVTAVQFWEKIAKLIPLSTSDTPKGNDWPGETFSDGPSDFWNACS